MTISRIHIGNGSEFVEVNVRANRGTQHWIDCDVEVKVRGFSASTSACIEPIDFQNFESQLRALYERLDGVADLRPREKQLILRLTGNGRGRVLVAGTAWYLACYGSKLDFEFEMDQTFLPAIVSQLNDLNGMLRVAR